MGVEVDQAQMPIVKLYIIDIEETFMNIYLGFHNLQRPLSRRNAQSLHIWTLLVKNPHWNAFIRNLVCCRLDLP